MSDGELSRLQVPMDLARSAVAYDRAGRAASGAPTRFAAATQLRGRQHRAAAIRNTGIQVSRPRLYPVDKSAREKEGLR